MMTTAEARDHWGNLESVRPVFISPKNGYYMKCSMVPERFFSMTNKGAYTLEVRMRTWVQQANGKYGVSISDPIRVEVDKK